ncbi:MAG: hopanoid biosynthesis associated radical SAM protein HpnH, partial [Alphaproteobacteria bacterium]|nr:hopanoid biosynthesis associated radical SAM protein HpnH [Alphaproteobacteria bacterium]
EGTAVADSVRHPWKLLGLRRHGVQTEGPMAPDIDLSRQRPAEYVFSRHVEQKLTEIRAAKPDTKKAQAAE